MRPHHSFVAAALLAPLAAAQDDAVAVYDVRFDATWSAVTHPNAYPSGAHFSPLIGGTHDDQVHFWQAGGIASQGIEVMAELGGTGPLRDEVEAQIANGHAGEVVTGGGTSSPGVVLTSLTVTDSFPLVTIVSMVAPSPDWFVGVDSLALLENGAWHDVVVAELFVWDAGTDSGPDFTSPNQDTNPQEPIALQTGGPFFGSVPLGTFTFTRRASTLTYGCGVNPAGSLSVGGLPSVGGSVTLTLNDPTGTMDTPAMTLVAVSVNADAAFPCGTLVPGFGLSGPGRPGELLLAPPFRRMPGPPYLGAPVDYALTMPGGSTWIGRTLYVQGFLVDGSGRVGATEGIELLIGP